MKNILPIILLSFTPFLNVSAQDVISSGAKSYTLYLNNPALMSNEDKSLIDISASTRSYLPYYSSSTLFLNSMFKLKKMNSNVRFSFLRQVNSYSAVVQVGTIGYSYGKDLNKKLKLAAGFDLNYYSVDNRRLIRSFGFNFHAHNPALKLIDNYLEGQIGIATKYNNLTIGTSSKFGIWNNIDSNSLNPNIDKGLQLFRIGLLVKYDFLIKDKVIITTQAEYLYNHDIVSERDYNLGVFVSYKKLIGLGLMFDSNQAKLTDFRYHLYNFSGQIRLFKNLELIAIYNPIFVDNPYYDNNHWEGTLQLRFSFN